MEKADDLGKSLTNAECISKCYPAKSVVYHPDTLHAVTNRNPFCLTKKWVNSRGEHQRTSKCMNPIKKMVSFEQSLFITPEFDFGYKDLLKIYKLKTFSDAMEYVLENNFLPNKTKNRIMNSVWHLFGRKIILSDEHILEFYLETTKTSWIDMIYEEVGTYLKIDKHNKVHISKTHVLDGDTKDTKKLKIEYIKRKMITSKIMLESLLNFEDYVKEKFDEIDNFQYLIFKYFIDHIIEKIKYSQ